MSKNITALSAHHFHHLHLLGTKTLRSLATRPSAHSFWCFLSIFLLRWIVLFLLGLISLFGVNKWGFLFTMFVFDCDLFLIDYLSGLATFDTKDSAYQVDKILGWRLVLVSLFILLFLLFLRRLTILISHIGNWRFNLTLFFTLNILGLGLLDGVNKVLYRYKTQPSKIHGFFLTQ